MLFSWEIAIMLLGNVQKVNGFKTFVITGILLSALVSSYFGSHALTKEFPLESLTYESFDTERLIIDDLSISIVSPGSQSISQGLELDFFLPFFLFQKPPYKKAFALRC